MRGKKTHFLKGFLKVCSVVLTGLKTKWLPESPRAFFLRDFDVLQGILYPSKNM